MAKVYQSDKVRNIVLLGHSGSGKTSLAEAMIFNSGASNRLGKVEEGNTVTDFDDEEIRRTISINAAVAPLEWKDHKINVIDAPGYLDFVGEVISSLSASDVAVMVLDGSSGVEVGTMLAWKRAAAMNVPRAVFINKMDRDNASYRRVIGELRNKFDATFVPMQLPIRDGEHFTGIVDLVTLQAYTGADADLADAPADMAAEIAEFRTELIEAAAESDDDLMMKYFDGEELSDDDIALGLGKGLKSGHLVPVFCGSATANVAVRSFMYNVIHNLPAPAQTVPVLQGDEETELDMTANGPLVVRIFKTVDDQYGTVSYFKVLSGTIKSDTRLYNPVSEAEERLGSLFLPRGKDQIPVDAVVAGDIGAVVKLSHTKTGDTLCYKKEQYRTLPVEYPEPLFAVAVHPKTQADTAKLGPTIQRLTATDPTLNVRNEPRTHEYLLEGMGETHIVVTVKRMADKYGLKIGRAHV